MIDSKPILAEPEVAARIRAFEEQHALWDIVVDGISLWRLLRFEASMEIQNLQLKRAPIKRRQLLGSLPRAGVQYLCAAKAGYRYIGKTSNSGLRDRRDGRFRDVYFDDLIDELPGGATMSSLDAAGFEQNSRSAYRQPAFDDTSVIVASAILARLFGKRTPSDASQMLARLLTDELGLTAFTARNIQRKYDVFRYRTSAYRAVLRRLQVQAVLAANNGLFALRHAATMMSIPFVEVQHGDYSPNHPDSLTPYALDSDRTSLLLPDYVAVFGRHDVSRLSATAMGALRLLRPVGLPSITKARLLRQRQFVPNPDLPVLTFTSQGFGQSRVHAFIAEFLATYTGPMRFVLRLHPGYDRDSSGYDDWARSDQRVEIMPGNSAVPTNKVIAISDLHLSISSTCHYDALGIGTPTAMLALPGYASMSDLLTESSAVLVETPRQLAQLVAARAWPQVTPEMSDYFFEPNYTQNMVRLFREWEEHPVEQNPL
jgi:hypothetical protein